MNEIEKRIIYAGYRLSSKSANSSTLILISFFINVLAIVTILNPTKIEFNFPQTNLVISVVDSAGANLYLRFLLRMNQALYQLIIVIFILLLEASFIYLLVKHQIGQFGQYLLSMIHYIKTALSLPIFALLVYSYEINIYIFLLSLIVMVISSITEYLCEQLNFTCLYSKKRSTDQRYNCCSAKIKIILKLVLSYSILRHNITIAEVVTLNSLLAFLYLYQIWKLLVDKIQKYNTFYEIANYLSWIFIISYNLINILALFIQLVHDNIELVLLSFFIWSCLAFHNVLEYSKSSLLIRPASQIKNQQQAITYIRLLYKIYENIQEHGNSILFLGLIKDHIGQCNKTECICKQRCKNVSISLLKDSDFFIKFVQLNIKHLQQKFDNIGIKIASLAFYVEALKKFPKYFYESELFKKKNVKDKLSLNLKFSLFLIQQQSLTQLGQKKTQYDKSAQNSSLIFKSEKKIQQCYEKLAKIITCLANMYRYNSRINCGVNLIEKQLQQNYKLSMQTRQIFEQKKDEEIMSLQFILLMLFFYKFIFNLTSKARLVLKRIEKIQKRFQVKEINSQNFNVSLYSSNGCVIQSVLQKNLFGTITKVSQNTPFLLGYPSTQSMIGIDVNKLLPRCMRDEHQRITNQWIQTGSFKKINQVQQSFCYNYEQKLMKVHFMSQVSVFNDQIIFFVGIVKSDDQNYMIISKQDQIDSYGSSFFNFLQNQFRFSPVHCIFPKWANISQKISKQSFHIRTQFSHKNKTCAKKSARKISEWNLDEQNVNLTIRMQLYRAQIGNDCFTVIKKLAFTKKQQKSSLFVVENFKTQAEQSANDSEQGLQKQKSKKTFQVNQDPRYIMELGSTSSSHNQTYTSLWKTIQQISEKAVAGQKIKYPLLTMITVVQLISLLLFVVALFSQFFLYVNGINSFNQIIFADSAVSDNMQLLEITYNNIMMYDQYCGPNSNFIKCESVKKSGDKIQQYLYSLMAKDIRDLIRNQTFFKNKYFFYEFIEVQLYINEGSTIPVGTFQFMEYFIRSSKYVLNQLQKNGQVGPDYEFIIHNLKLNWPEMKRINHLNLQLYQAVGIKQLDECINYIIIISVVSSIFITIYILAQYSHYKRKIQLLNKVIVLYRLIPPKTSQTLWQYYEEMQKTISYKNIQKITQIQFVKIDDTHLNSRFNFSQQKNTKIVFLLASYWFVLIFFVGLLNFKFNEYNSLWKQSLISIGSLMDSQNYLFENYFELKAFYLHPPNALTPEQFQKQLFANLKQNQNQFVRIGLSTSEIFSFHNNPQLANQFSDLLINNICQVTKEITSDEENKQCYEATKMKLYQEGIVAFMTYFQRIVFETAFRLIKYPNLNPDQYFQQYTLSDIDQFLLYMLKMYQGSQALMIEGLKIFIDNRLLIIGFILGAQVFIFMLSFVYWLLTMNKKRKELAAIYGYALSFPIALLKQSKYVQQQFSLLLGAI